VTISDYRKTPWPWFGGKADAADLVWSALGDVDHYVEPFAGSLAVLMRRPHPCNRTYYSETVNDFDGLLCNAWRSIALSPEATAEAASWPVCEADLHARHLRLVTWKAETQLERLMGDPQWHDPVMAGWWIWGTCCWIGSGWCSGKGPWIVGEDGRITKRPGGVGVSRKLPYLTTNGKGVNHPGTREPGVSRQLPHLGDNGMGVNHAGTREPGVSRQLPHLGNNGQGVNAPQIREPGVENEEHEYHPMTMPELRKWIGFLSARLRHVRILNGDWKRAVTSGASKTLSVRMGGHVGIFLDPPYADSAKRTSDLYAEDSGTVAHEAADWALERGTDPTTRIVFAGFVGEHGTRFTDAGWREVEWFKKGFLKGGMANVRVATDDDADGVTHQQGRERLWLSPHCLQQGEVPAQRQTSMF